MTDLHQPGIIILASFHRHRDSTMPILKMIVALLYISSSLLQQYQGRNGDG